MDDHKKQKFLELNSPCSGCDSFNTTYNDYLGDYIEPCFHIPYNENGDCPCTNCLIKVMCGQECDTWVAWTYENKGKKYNEKSM